MRGRGEGGGKKEERRERRGREGKDGSASTSFLFLHLSLHSILHLFLLPPSDYERERERRGEDIGWSDDELNGISEG